MLFNHFYIKGISTYFAKTLSTNGSAGGSKHFGHNFGKKESSSSVLLVMVEIENSENRRTF